MTHRADGWPYRPRGEYIFVADYGQPDRSEGGLYLGDFDFGMYKFNTWRYGEVIAVGPGRLNWKGVRFPMPDLQIGDVVAFSRKHGTRLPGDIRYDHPNIPSSDGLLVRVLDPDKIVVVVDDFEPWWNVANRQVDPRIDFSG